MKKGSITLGEIEGEPFKLKIEDIIGSRTAVIAMNGSGKTDIVMNICANIAEKDGSFVIIDPEGKFGVLKQRYEIVWAGRVPEADLLLTLRRSERLAETLVKKGGRLIMDTSDCDDTHEEIEIVTAFLEHFYKLQWEEKRPVLMVVGEAHRFMAEAEEEKIDRLVEICKRGKKRGIGVLMYTHKPQLLDRSILSKFENQFIGRLKTNNDKEAVFQFIDSTETLMGLPDLKEGQFNLMGEFLPDGGLLEMKTTSGTKDRGKKFDVAEFLSDVKEEVVSEEEPKKKKKKKKKTLEPEILDDEEEEEREPHGDDDILEEEEEMPIKKKKKKGKKKKPRIEEEIEEEEEEEEEEEYEEPEPKKKKRKKGSELVEVTTDIIDIETGSEVQSLDAELVDVDQDEEVMRGPPIRGLKFDMKEEKALEIVKKEIKKTLLKRKTKETIEEIDAIYWPLFWCRMVKAKRFFFSLKSNNYFTVFDPLLLRFLRFKDEHDLKPILELDNRLIRLAKDGEHWREIRVLVALQKEDMTINDMVPSSGLPRTELREAVAKLKEQKLIKKSEDVGDVKMYMPTLQMKVPSLKDLKTKLPALSTVRPKLEVEVMRPQYSDVMVRTLVSGFFKDVALISAETFFMPYYRVQVMHRKKRTRRIMLVNARTGSVLTLSGKQAEAFI